ncbi:MAG: xanthine dehydrogenase family protein molybdopterin-binding subunit, partial [Thermomicrobiales bacterium]
PGNLHARTVFGHRVHARLLSLDTAPALAIDGVVAVLTADDVPLNAYGLIDADQPVFCAVGDCVRFEGDKIAVVVAETIVAAERGAAALCVEFEDLPAVTDPEAAMAPDAPRVHACRESNVLLHVPIRKGDVDAALAAADVVISGTFATQWQEHAFLQPEAATAWVEPDGTVVIESAGQWLHEDRRQIAAILRLPEEQVVIRYNAIGGAFGGREDLSLQHVAALAAWRLRDRFPGRKVAIQWSREESIVGHHKRHPMRIETTWGAMRDGTITAVRSRLVADGGAYASTSVEVVKIATVFASGCYEVPNIAADGYAVYTNNVPSGAFRGFGAPQAQFAAESMVTRLAHALNMDPLDLRRRNIYREGSIEPTQEPLPAGVTALPVLEAVAAEASSRFRTCGGRDNPPHLKRGVGFACGIKNVGYSFGFPDQATATVELFGRGEVERAIVRVGAADVGQGAHLAMRQIAAGVLNLPLAQIEMVTDDSSTAPNAGSASASRLTLMAGRAVHDAASEALAAYLNSEDQHVTATAQFRPGSTTTLEPETGRGRPNYSYGYAAQAVEVEVNTLTGQVRVLSIISGHDVGKAINRQQVEGQIEGCLAQALGYTLMEDFQVRDGRILTQYLSTYLLPTAQDMPAEIVPLILEFADPLGPFGARGMAEMPMVPFAPAVAMAIHDATGVWLSDLPFTPSRVLAAIVERERNGG